MTEDFKDIQEKPTLTLDPFQETAVPKAEFPAMQEEPEMDETVLSEEERQMAEQFAQQIDLTDSSMILQYGIGTQKKMADFSESALENVRTKDLGEIGNLLSGVVSELKNFDEEEEKGFLGFFKKQSNKIQNMKIKYAKTEANINQICQVLENHQVQLMKDIALLDKMYDLNRTYFKELTMYIIAGKKKLKEVREGQLQVMLAKAQQSGLAEDAQAARDLDSMCQRFEKKDSRSGTDQDDLHSDGAADQAGAGQRYGNDRKNPVYSGKHHSSLEKPDGSGLRCRSFDPGGKGAARGYGYDQ